MKTGFFCKIKTDIHRHFAFGSPLPLCKTSWIVIFFFYCYKNCFYKKMLFCTTIQTNDSHYRNDIIKFLHRKLLNSQRRVHEKSLQISPRYLKSVDPCQEALYISADCLAKGSMSLGKDRRKSERKRGFCKWHFRCECGQGISHTLFCILVNPHT